LDIKKESFSILNSKSYFEVPFFAAKTTLTHSFPFAGINL
jgi:hypothetical protein